MTVGVRIADLRRQSHMSQFQLAKVLKIGTSTLGMYETGKREPSPKVLKRIADYFDVSIDYLLGRKQTEKKTADLADDETIFTYEGKKIPPEDLEYMKRILRGGKA